MRNPALGWRGFVLILLVGCGPVGQVPTTSSVSPTSSSPEPFSSTAEVEIRTLPPYRGRAEDFMAPVLALPGRYQTTVFEPPFRFTLEGSWMALGESSNAVGLTARTPAEGDCELRTATGVSLCFDFLAFFGSGVVGDFDLVELLRDHPEVVREPWETEIAGHRAAAIELSIEEGEEILPSELPETIYVFTYTGNGSMRFLELEDHPFGVALISPTPQGLALFVSKAEQVVDSIEFMGG